MAVTKTLLLVAGAALAAAACEGPDPVADNLESAAALPGGERAPPDEMTGAGAAKAESPARSAAAQTVAAAAIPPRLRGTWGLYPADCEPDASTDARLVVTADALNFRASSASPAANIETSPDSISGDFAFRRGDQAWTRFQALELQDGKLIRIQSAPMRSFTYIRCGA